MHANWLEFHFEISNRVAANQVIQPIKLSLMVQLLIIIFFVVVVEYSADKVHLSREM